MKAIQFHQREPEKRPERGDKATPQFHTPRVDIVETGEKITLTADLPGVSRENLGITIDGDKLELAGTITPGREGEKFLHREFRIPGYKRSFTLGTEICADEIQATLDNGVLTVILPRRKREGSRKIEIR